MVISKTTKKKIVKSIVSKKKITSIKKLKKNPKKVITKFVGSRKKKGKKVVAPKKKKIIKKKIIKRLEKKEEGLRLKKSIRNPIIKPTYYSWESQAAFNPAAITSGGLVHLFYRALGNDGISRIGYASSKDGVNFETRLSYPVYVGENLEEAKKHWPYTSPARLTFDPGTYTSGGGWGGCEDPRCVIIDGTVYMTFNMFNGWHSMRVAVVSIKEEDLKNRRWFWKNFAYLSRPGDRQKNWVLFPEKINGKFALFCNLDKGDPDKVYIAYLNNLDATETPSQIDAPDPQVLPDHDVAWHFRTRSAAAPPIKTKDGWLLLYHAMEKNDSNKYKVGAMLLDLKNPEKVLYRAQHPILEPDAWYENDYKPGIIYANGAIVKDGELFVYYGGGDKHVAVAHINLAELLKDMKSNKPIQLKKSNKNEIL